MPVFVLFNPFNNDFRCSMSFTSEVFQRQRAPVEHDSALRLLLQVSGA